MAPVAGWNGPLGQLARLLVWADNGLDHENVTTFLKSDNSVLEILSRRKHALKDSVKSGLTGSPGRSVWLRQVKCAEMVLDLVLEDVPVSLVNPVVAGTQLNKEHVPSVPARGVSGVRLLSARPSSQDAVSDRQLTLEAVTVVPVHVLVSVKSEKCAS